MTYARRFDPSGAPLAAEDFKPVPEGHTGGSLNMVQAFVGHLLANALTGNTRGWIMGQGHCVAAIEAVNALTGDVSEGQRGRYDRSEAGLARLLRDFYSYAIDAQGRPAVPLGSHAGPHTAGAVSEGGYLGFAELQYVHMPLPGESLVAFLSDGAFESAVRTGAALWRARTAVPDPGDDPQRPAHRAAPRSQQGGAEWLAGTCAQRLRPGGGGRARSGCHRLGIIQGEDALRALPTTRTDAIRRLPYVIAETERFGFPGRAQCRPQPSAGRQSALTPRAGLSRSAAPVRAAGEWSGAGGAATRPGRCWKRHPMAHATRLRQAAGASMAPPGARSAMDVMDAGSWSWRGEPGCAWHRQPG